MKVIQRPAGFMALTEDAIAVTQQKMTGFSELSLASTPVEERHLKLLLEVLDLQTHRRLRDIEAVSSFLETALTDDGPEDAQLIQGEGQIGHGELPGKQQMLKNCKGLAAGQTPESRLSQHLVG